MASRPRRSAAQRANEAITDMADSERTSSMSTRSRRSEGRTSGASISRGPPSSPGNDHLNLTVKLPASKLREATTGRRTYASGNQIAVNSRENFVGGEIIAGKRNRGTKKSYVVESDSDEEDEPEAEDDDDMEEPGEEDAEGEEDDMDVDAEGEDDDLGEEDADGDIDMDAAPAPLPTIKIQLPKAKKPSQPYSAPRRPIASRIIDDDDDDEEELSEIESDIDDVGEMSIDVGGAGIADAEGEEEEEIEVADEDEEEEEEEEEDEPELEQEPDAEADEEDDGDSDDESPDAGSRAETPDMTKMTKRQRARFEDEPQEYMKLSDEVQVKKVFTAEELSMRRAEMARRRRNLSDKRNEEVKMETINKLLKKQAPKGKGRGGAGSDEYPGGESQNPNSVFVRWVSTKQGSRVGVPEDMLRGPAGKVFTGNGALRSSGKMVEEVA